MIQNTGATFDKEGRPRAFSHDNEANLAANPCQRGSSSCTCSTPLWMVYLASMEKKKHNSLTLRQWNPSCANSDESLTPLIRFKQLSRGQGKRPGPEWGRDPGSVILFHSQPSSSSISSAATKIHAGNCLKPTTEQQNSCSPNACVPTPTSLLWKQN